MINFDKTPIGIAREVAQNFVISRKRNKITIKELAERSGISYSSIRRFEKLGEISFVSLIKIASVLNLEDQLITLFSESVPTTIEEVLATNR